MAKTQHQQTPIFVIVQGVVAEVDPATVPEGVEVEIVDLDDVGSDPSAGEKLSPVAQAYARRRGYL